MDKEFAEAFKEEIELAEKWEVGVVYHQDFGGGEISYFRADSLLKNKRWKGMSVDEFGGKQKRPKNITADEKVQGWKITPKDKIPKGLKEDMDKEFAEAFKEEIEKEASTYRDKAKDDEKKKKRHFAFGGKKDKTRHGSGGYGKGEEVKKEDYDKNQLLRVKHDEALIAEAGDICALNRGVLRSKSMQSVWEKKCAPKLNNQTLGEDKMEKLVDTVRKVLVGEEEKELSDKQKAYKKFFDKTLKKFDINSPADLKGDEEKKKFYDYIDKNWKGEHEEVEVKKKVTEGVDLKKLKKEYEDNEDKNNHTGNYLLLAKAFGSKSDVKKVEEIMKRNEKQGSTSKKDMDWMYKNINPYYDKIRNEEVKVEKTVSKLFSHVRKLMSK